MEVGVLKKWGWGDNENWLGLGGDGFLGITQSCNFTKNKWGITQKYGFSLNC